MTEQDLMDAGYSKVDALSRYSVWVDGETGELYVHDGDDGTLREFAGPDMVLRVFLRVLEGSGDLLGGTVEGGAR